MLTSKKEYKWAMQFFNAWEETFEAKTKLQLWLDSMQNIGTTSPWETITPRAKQADKTHLLLYPFDGNKTFTTIS